VVLRPGAKLAYHENAVPGMSPFVIFDPHALQD
jgi:hypothetical protein